MFSLYVSCFFLVFFLYIHVAASAEVCLLGNRLVAYTHLVGDLSADVVDKY